MAQTNREKALNYLKNGEGGIYDELGAAYPQAANTQIEEVVANDNLKGIQINVSGAPSEYIMFYLHGGGYVQCSPNTYKNIISDMANKAGINTFLLKYRLAPQHPYPAALEDAIKGYKALLNQGKKIILTGDSAGGGLAFCLAHYLKKENLLLPELLMGISPWVDLREGSFWLDTEEDTQILNGTADLYCEEHQKNDPLVSPILSDFTGYPPSFIVMGETDFLKEQVLAAQQKAANAGITLTSKVYPGVAHAWYYDPTHEQTKALFNDVGSFINQHIAK